MMTTTVGVDIEALFPFRDLRMERVDAIVILIHQNVHQLFDNQLLPLTSFRSSFSICL
jgi:hypothetical protein